MSVNLLHISARHRCAILFGSLLSSQHDALKMVCCTVWGKNSHTLAHALKSQLKRKNVHDTNIKTLQEVFLPAPGVIL